MSEDRNREKVAHEAPKFTRSLSEFGIIILTLSELSPGVSVLVSSNEPAAGLVYVSISRKTAKRAHIKVGRGPQVTIGRGTVSGIKAGSQSLHLHLHLSRTMATKLQRLRHVALTIRLALVDSGNHHFAIDAAARY